MSGGYLQVSIDFLLDLLFPIECIRCKKEGIWLCKTCFEAINIFNPDFLACPTCKKINKDKSAGAFCKRHFSFLQGVWIIGDFNNKNLRQSIHLFKYKYVEDFQEILGSLVVNFLSKLTDNNLPFHFDAVAFVPLHKRRQAERGYNQSELLASRVAQCLNLPLLNILTRKKYTTPQVSLTMEERKANVRGAFAYNSQNNIAGKNILLVDDVYTTGSTLIECAKELKKDHAKKIWALVLAKG